MQVGRGAEKGMGWLTESTILPKRSQKLKINSATASLLELKTLVFSSQRLQSSSIQKGFTGGQLKFNDAESRIDSLRKENDRLAMEIQEGFTKRDKFHENVESQPRSYSEHSVGKVVNDLVDFEAKEQFQKSFEPKKEASIGDMDQKARTDFWVNLHEALQNHQARKHETTEEKADEVVGEMTKDIVNRQRIAIKKQARHQKLIRHFAQRDQILALFY